LNRQALGDIVVGIVISCMMMGCIFLIEWAAGWLTIDGFAWQKSSAGQVVRDMLFMLLFYIIVGWQEELSSRGYQLQNLAEGLNLLFAVLISSAMFALLHLMNPSISFMAVVGLFFSGLFLAFSYVATRQLWLPIGLHIGWNFFESSLFGFQVSGYGGWPRLILQTVRGNIFFTGGDFGPEAGLVLLPGLMLGALLIYLYTRNRDKNSIQPEPIN
jgi:membrane protease YdiL (CAAX protease family)